MVVPTLKLPVRDLFWALKRPPVPLLASSLEGVAVTFGNLGMLG